MKKIYIGEYSVQCSGNLFYIGGSSLLQGSSDPCFEEIGGCFNHL